MSVGTRFSFGAALVLALIVGGTGHDLVARADESGVVAAPGPVPPPSQERDLVMLRIAGEEILAATIIPTIAGNYLQRRGAQTIRVAKAAAPWTTEISGRLLNGKRAVVLIRNSSTEEGFRQLADGTVDIALAGRKITPEEVRDMPSLSGILEAADSVAIARAAIAVVVHPTNPMEAITLQQLHDIYAGKVTDWAQLGGAPGKIHVFSRQTNSTARELFDSAVMGTTSVAQSARPFSTFEALRAALFTDPNGIGYLAIPDGVKELRIDVNGRTGVSPPSNYEVASGDYPVSQVLYLYRGLKAGNGEVSTFFHETVSVASQVAVTSAGLFGLAPQLIVPEASRPASDEYRALTSNGLRVSTTIRFVDGSAKIDAATSQQLDVLANYLRRLNVSGDQLMHIAFSQNTGDPVKNTEISRHLGQIVVDELQKRRVVPGDVFPLGGAVRLGSDLTPMGRGLNRRVETWIRP